MEQYPVDIVCMEQSSPEVHHLESAYLFMTPFLLLPMSEL